MKGVTNFVKNKSYTFFMNRLAVGIYRAVVLNLFRGTEPHKFHTYIKPFVVRAFFLLQIQNTCI